MNAIGICKYCGDIITTEDDSHRNRTYFCSPRCKNNFAHVCEKTQNKLIKHHQEILDEIYTKSIKHLQQYFDELITDTFKNF